MVCFVRWYRRGLLPGEKTDTDNLASIAASTDDAGSGTVGDVCNTAVAVDTFVVVDNVVVAAAAAVGVDDDVHDDAAAAVADDDDGTSRYCIHPCHVAESLPARPRCDAKKNRNGARTHTQTVNISIIYRWDTIVRVTGSVIERNPRHFCAGIRVSFGIIAIKHDRATLMAVEGRYRFAK